MILTEEQRWALAHAINYIDETDLPVGELDGFDREVLRAMIDSSGPIPDVTELVELLAAGEHEQWAVWAQAILDSEPGLSDGRKAAWPEMIATPYENLSEELKNKDRREVYLRSQAALDYIQQQSTEIERLRAIIDTPSEEPEWVVDFKKLNRFAGAGYSLIDIEIAKKWHTAYRKAQNSNLLRKQEIERLRASLIDLHAEYINTLEKNPECSAWDLDEQSDADQKRLRRNAAHAISIVEPPIYLQAEQRATKIKELEDVHKRSGVKYAKIINELRSSVYANIPGLKKQWDEILNAPANGKIGPDADAKPQVWQITEERKAAIKELSELLTAIGCPSCHYYIQKNYGEDITVLRAMLTEAGQE